MPKIFRLLIFVLTLVFLHAEAEAISYIPPVKNYPVTDYKAGNQNWTVAQGSDGWMFFGNNRGLLQFDGIRWKLHRLPNNNAVRSILVTPDGRVYVGSFEEFGFFEIDDKGQFCYSSLKDSVSGYDFNNDEIWTINEFEGRIYFQSFSSYFIYDGKNTQTGEPDMPPLYFFSLNKGLYAQFQRRGFYRNHGDGFEEVIPRELLNDDVVGILPYGNGLLLVTAMNGIFLYSDGKVSVWKTPVCERLKTTIANRVVMMADSTYIAGTISNGLIAFDKNGKTVWEVNRNNKLINNTILGLFADSAGDLWVACDNGIAHVRTSSPIQYADFSGMDFGMLHDMLVDKGTFYLATNQGVYSVPESKGIPKMIPGSEAQAWYISNEDNKLFVGHNKGILVIENGKAVRIPGERGGGTAMKKCIIHGREILLQVSYGVLSIFTKNKAGEWEFSHDVKGFNNLIKSFEVDFTGNIWASHMHKGLYRIQLDNSLQHVTEAEYTGALSPGKPEGIINVMKLRGRIVFTDREKFYTYDDMGRRIIPYEQMNERYSGLANSYRIIALDNDRYWFVSDAEYALMAYDGGILKLHESVPFSVFDNPPIEMRGNIHTDKDGTTYFCLNGGFAVFSSGKEYAGKTKNPLSLASVRVSTRDNRKSFFLPRKQDVPVEIKYTYNDITFDFAYPNYDEYGLNIRCRLDGFETEWTDIPADIPRTYSNLPFGNYVLHAKEYDQRGNEKSSFSYPFIIKPPFYQSAYAYAIYVLLFLFLSVMLIRAYAGWEVARVKKNAAIRHIRQEEQLKLQEQTIMKLEKEKLEDEVTYKSKELASATLSVISQNEFLEQLKAEVQEQRLSGHYSKAFFDRLIRMINDNITRKGDWTVFLSNFDRIHERFFVKLKERSPDLTSGDLRMCALLRLNMPTKDMASMLNLSVRGVEAARYRLRKKLNLAEGENLTDFVLKFT